MRLNAYKEMYLVQFVSLFLFSVCSTSVDAASLTDYAESLVVALENGIFSVEDAMQHYNTSFAEKDTLYIYYSKKYPKGITLTENTYHYAKPKILTVILIAGWGSSVNNNLLDDLLVPEYLRKGGYQIVSVYYTKCSTMNYVEAAACTDSVGKIIATFIKNITDGSPELITRVHVIGHSLGAQIAGFAGQYFKSFGKEQLKRITGLDAAGPLFDFPVRVPTNFKLSADDAEQVEGFHTDGGILGTASKYAKADFFFNYGGPFQPGCSGNGTLQLISCSHERSAVYYAESINSKRFVAEECRNAYFYTTGKCKSNAKVIVGEQASLNDTGSFYLSTNVHYPYARG